MTLIFDNHFHRNNIRILPHQGHVGMIGRPTTFAVLASLYIQKSLAMTPETRRAIRIISDERVAHAVARGDGNTARVDRDGMIRFSAINATPVLMVADPVFASTPESTSLNTMTSIEKRSNFRNRLRQPQSRTKHYYCSSLCRPKEQTVQAKGSAYISSCSLPILPGSVSALRQPFRPKSRLVLNGVLSQQSRHIQATLTPKDNALPQHLPIYLAVLFFFEISFLFFSRVFNMRDHASLLQPFHLSTSTTRI